MALVERLMGLNDDGGEPTDSRADKIPTHSFFAAGSEIIAGALTVAQVKGLFSMRSTEDASGRSDAGDFDALIALAPGAGQLAQRALFLERLHSVFILAEGRVAGYSTAAAIRSKLGF